MTRSLHIIHGTCVLLLFSGLAQAIIDENSNGLSDVWERHFNKGALFAETFEPQADSDGDGWTNAEEADAGTDPSTANPPYGLVAPEILHSPAVIGEENGQPVIITPEALTITWPTLVGKQYALLFSPGLAPASWLPVGTAFIGNGNLVSYGFLIDPNTPKLFWRVAVSDVDSDGDGMTDSEEYLMNLDADNDGVPDEWERRYAQGTYI